VIEDLLKNEFFLKVFPPLAGAVFVLLFVSLGLWQLDRAREKVGFLAAFDSDAPYVVPADFGALGDFDRVQVFGHYLADRQVLIDNIPLEGRLGYFVITPFAPSSREPLLLVNRGWIARPDDAGTLPDLSVDTEFKTIRGLVGHLPRVAIRPGEAFAVHGDWPRVAVYPSLREVADELGEEVLPIVLLLRPEAEDGFVRHWQPNVSGPMTHYSYAFQWFALALAVVAITAWHLHKRYRRDRS